MAGLYIRRAPDVAAKDSGQFGVNFQVILMMLDLVLNGTIF